MPIVKDAKHVCINMGEVEEIVQIIAPQGLQDPKELVGKVSSLLWRCIVKFLQWSGARTDQKSTTGAQVLGQWPALRPGEDLPSQKDQALDTEKSHIGSLFSTSCPQPTQISLTASLALKTFWQNISPSFYTFWDMVRPLSFSHFCSVLLMEGFRKEAALISAVY